MKQKAHHFHPRDNFERTLFKSIWRAERTPTATEEEIILPKGTAEIIFNLTQRTFCYKETENKGGYLPSCFINGLNTSPWHLVRRESQTFLGIQLHVSALRFVFGIPAGEFTDRIINGFEVCRQLQDLSEQIATELDFGRQASLIIRWLRQQAVVEDNDAERALLFNLHSRDDILDLSVKTLCRNLNLSDRHLRRLSAHYLGINTEDFILYRRFVKALFETHDTNLPLSAIAYDCGFYDQAHFIRSFRAYAGITPGEYRQTMSDLPGHLYSPK